MIAQTPYQYIFAYLSCQCGLVEKVRSVSMLARLEGSPGRAFRDLMTQGTLLMPGVYDGISARATYKAGAKAMYVTGAVQAAHGAPGHASGWAV